jgi:hypothetical protein
MQTQGCSWGRSSPLVFFFFYAGLLVAPVFTMGQIVFLMAFVVYIAAAVMALVMDFDACLQNKTPKSSTQCLVT